MSEEFLSILKPETTEPVLNSVTVPSRHDVVELENQEEAVESPSFSEGWTVARDLDSTAHAVSNIEQDMLQEVDYNWEGLEEKDFEESGVPEEHWGELSTSLSANDFELKKMRYFEESANEQVLADMGVAGVFTRLGANVLDEGAVGLTLATAPFTGGAAPAAVGTFKATRLARALKLGLVAGAENAALEGVLAKAKITSDWTDVVYAGLGGFTLGTAVGGLSKGAQAQLDRGLEGVLEATDNAAIRNVIKYNDLSFEHNAGAAKVDLRTPEAFDADVDIVPEEIGKAKTAKVTLFGIPLPRIDIGGRLGGSDSAAVRHMSNKMMEDGVALEGDAVNSAGGSASHWKRLYMKTYQISWRKDAEPAFNKWKKENHSFTDGILSPIKIRSEFNEEVSKYLELGDKSGVSDPHVIRAANAQAKVYEDVLLEGQKQGVKAMQDVVPNKNYVPHLWQESKFKEFRKQYGDQPILLLKQALIDGSDELEPELADTIAKGMWKKMNSKAYGLSNPSGSFVRLDDVHDLRKLLTEETEMADDHIEGIIETILFKKAKENPNAGKPDRFKRRLNFDMTTVMPFKNADGSLGDEVSLMSLMERDSEKIMNQYLNQTSGMMGMARKGWKDKKGFDDALTRAKLKVADIDDAQKVEDLFRVAERSIMGKPMYDKNHKNHAKFIRMLSDLSYTRYMGQTGAASFAEMGQAIAYGGVRNALRQMPGVKELARTIADGNYTDDLAEEIEVFVGSGTHSINNQISSRSFDHDLEFFNKALDNIDKTLQVAKVATSKYSGLVKVTDATQRVATRAAAQRIFGYAQAAGEGGFDKLWSKNWRRMQGYGVSKEDAQNIFKYMNIHSEGSESLMFKGKTLNKMNISKWGTDEAGTKAADDFTMFLHRITTHAVQEEDVGNLHEWMHNPWIGKILMQFRRFIMGAYTKSTLNGLHYFDAAAGLGMIMSGTFGTAAYMFQTAANSIGREDQKEHLNERFGMTDLIKAGVQRSAFASFAPMIVDGLFSDFGKDPIFSYRSSGLGSGFEGIPVIDTAKKIHQSAVSLTSPFTPREYTASDLDAKTKLAPMSNLWGLRNFVHIINDGLLDLPEEQQDTEWELFD